MKISKIVVLCAALCVLFGACAKKNTGEFTINKDKFIVGMEITYPPLEFYSEDGKTPQGFDVDMAKALARELGLNVEFVDAEFGGLFGGINAGKFDALISGVTITPERSEQFLFTKPYIGNAMTIVVLNDAPFQITKPEDIAGYRVSYQENTTAEIYASNIRKQGYEYQEFKYPSVMNCFEDLKFNRVDIIIVDSLVALEYLERDPGLYKIVYQGEADEYFGICLKKGNDVLAEKLNTAIDKIKASGELTDISLKYFNMDLVSVIK
ncbi:MAG: ABC transporter substrate-binding protein [Spirochaetaceae bacterium]|jgi:polar amino acid transport system substrate-binding protein|nr:ABC transporter substrate-binding protein [Spirochaetaceae bacterium]